MVEIDVEFYVGIIKTTAIATAIIKKALQSFDVQSFIKFVGGLDGTRTRDPLRDRQVF